MDVDVRVDLYIDGAWVDKTTDFLPGVAINRGQADEQTELAYSRAELTLKDPTGLYNNRNPASPLFGKLTPNMPIRVRVGSDVRAVMEVADFSPQVDSGVRALVPIQARGISWRLQQAKKDQTSPLRKSIIFCGPVAYWPVEDDAGATQVGAVTGQPMSIGGTVAFGSDSGLAGSDPLAVPASGSLLFGYVPAFPAGYDAQSDQWSLTWQMKVPAAPAADTTLLHWWAYGTVGQWQVILTAAGKVVVKGYDSTFTELFAHAGTDFLGSPFTASVYGQWLQWTAIIDNSATPDFVMTVTWSLIDTVGVKSRAATVAAGGTARQPWAVEHAGFGASFGHLAALAHNAPCSVFAAFGWPGDTAANRIQRLCDEAGVTLTVVGTALDSASMGPQTKSDLVTLLKEAVEADRGVLYETRDALGLTYVTAQRLYNQASALDLDYSHVAELATGDDDQHTWNDVTVARPDGSSVRKVLESGPLSTQAPPDGVGTYDRGQRTAHVMGDDQLGPLAGWLRHLGTVDERRLPAITVNLAGDAWVNNTARTALAAAVDIAEAGTVANLPTYIRGVDQLVPFQVLGYTERIDKVARTITWFTRPGWAWEVWQLDTGGSTLAVAASVSATSLKFATSSGPPWDVAHEPYHAQIDGEALTVTTMSTDTPTFVASGTVAHANNASVTPGLPAGLADGDALLVWAAIRGSGTATPNTPTGYTLLADCSNARLYGRYRVTGDTAPTISFTGGAAGDDTSARMFAFRGASLELDGAAATQLNGSAQDIAYPAKTVRRANCTVLYLGWKQDDWTSVATIGGATEDVDDSTIIGNDQGIVVDHVIQTTATNIAAGSFTVTGGVSAISRGAVVTLRPLQTATVTRAVNGASKPLSAGKTVKGWRLGVLAL